MEVFRRDALGFGDGFHAAGENVVWCEERQAGVMMVVVVPAEKFVAPLARMGDVDEAARIVRLVLRGPEVRLGVGVVVGDARARVASLHAELGKQVGEAVAGHRSSSVLVDDELAGLHPVAADSLGEQLFGQCCVLAGCNHPGDDVAAEQIQDHVQAQEGATFVGRELRDVPRPHFVGCGRDQARNRKTPWLPLLAAFLDGASDVCEQCGAEYVGGDLDGHDEFTVATTAVGGTDDPVLRSGATPGEHVCVTGTLGRSGAALRLFRDDGSGVERANDLFRFEPRVAAGRALAPHAGAMMDSSDGLARSLHQLAEASDCGFTVEYDALPVDDAVRTLADDPADERERAVHFGEDFELVFTTDDPDAARDASPTPVTSVGRVTEPGDGVELDGEHLPDRGFTHGE